MSEKTGRSENIRCFFVNCLWCKCMKRTEPIRIAHIIGKLNAGGVESVVNNYYRNIDHKKYQFDYFIDSDGGCQPPQELIGMGARYFVIPPYQNLFQYIKVLTKYFKENHYSVVHSGMNTLAVFSLFAAWLAHVPVRINHNHSTASKGETKKNILKYLLRPFAKLFATHYCACSRYAGIWLFGKKTVAQGKVKIFNNAINVESFVYNPIIRDKVRKELDLKDKFVVGHVGRFCFQKNHEFLIDVFKAVHEKEKNAVLLLVGIGELQEAIKQKVFDLGLQSSVIFLGARKDVNKLYQAMDVFVLPSRYEGLPVVGVEAQAAGLPCILSDQMTDETVIVKETKVLPLDSDRAVWAKIILETKKNNRRNTMENVKNAGLDIKTEAKKMEAYYDTVIKSIIL